MLYYVILYLGSSSEAYAAERQAVGRASSTRGCHLGKTKKVAKVVRLVV